MKSDLNINIEPWDADHQKWSELLEIIDSMKQTDWFFMNADFHQSSHALVALIDGAIAGFLRFTVQEIGPDRDLPAIQLKGITLTEAKILAFGVITPFQNLGIGKNLQEHAIKHAKTLGCYQVRSHSGGDAEANHHLKLSLGFGVHPTLKDDDDPRGVFFVKTL